MTQKRKYPKKKLNIRNDQRPNGKAWKKGLSPVERGIVSKCGHPVKNEESK